MNLKDYYMLRKNECGYYKDFGEFNKKISDC